MDEFRDLLGKTQEVAKEMQEQTKDDTQSQEQDAKPKPQNIVQPNDSKEENPNIVRNVFITNAKIPSAQQKNKKSE